MNAPSWLLPVSVVALSLVAGVGLAYAVTKPPRSAREIAHEERQRIHRQQARSRARMATR